MNTKYTKNTLNTDNGASRYLNNKNNNNANTYNVICIYIYTYIYLVAKQIMRELCCNCCCTVVL